MQLKVWRVGSIARNWEKIALAGMKLIPESIASCN
jgi:hypothetical protein